jgi:uncharacterized protein (TIGR03437 family)
VRASIGRAAALLAFAWLAATPARATDCRLAFADQSNWDRKLGFYVGLENSAAGTADCQLNTLRIAMGVADGSDWRFIIYTPPAWQMDHDYTAVVTITPSYFEMTLDGQTVGHVEGGFTGLPANSLVVDNIPGWASGSANYLVSQNSLQASASGGASVLIDRSSAASRPLPLRLLAPGNTPASLPFVFTPGESIQLTAVFRLSATSNYLQFAPYFDRYGQSIHASFPGKITSDQDLLDAAAEEERRLTDWGVPAGYDEYGGLSTAGWSETASGYYRVVQKNGVWWLVSPTGNPCFYLGIDNAPALAWDRTPVTGRTNLFEWIPPKAAPYDAIWGADSWGLHDGSQDVGYAGVNLIRKYGDGWKTKATDSALRRAKVWGFSGFGKWDNTAPIPELPVLGRWDVPTIGRHPDIFDPAVQQQYRASLASQIGDRATDPTVVGWSLGNEYDEIVTADETQGMLQLGASVAAKKALVDEALRSLYDGSVAKLAAAWRVKAATVAEVYAATSPSVSATDLETLRQYFARSYYGWVYRTVKDLDPNHLYFGFWIVPGWWENESDWDLGAEFVDVIGYDRYAAQFNDNWLNGLIARTGKPVFCGEFAFPPHYNLARGYRQYPLASAVDDAAAGQAYRQWVMDAARHPYAVGVAWFQYRDEPISGRGPGVGPDLVYGEDFAFGLVDVGDRPKWEMVSAMREANLAAGPRRLNFRPPALNAGGAVNAASFAAGAPVAPGSLISIFGIDLTADGDAASGLPLPPKLGGASLRIGGVAVPLVHATPPYQIDAQVPWELAGQTAADLTITTDGLAGNHIGVAIAPYAPGIFTADSSGSGQGAVLINSTTLLAAPQSSPWQGRPAKRGEWLNVFCTGLGAVSMQPASGAGAPADPPATTLTPVHVKIGGLDAEVNFSGLAAGYAGLYQVNVRTPDSAPTGDSIPLSIEIGGVNSNVVTVAIE